MELMTDSTLVTEVIEVVRGAAKIPAQILITAESRVVDDLAIDSLDLVGVFLAIQDHFDIAIDDEDVPNLQRIADLAEYVANRRGSLAA
jgi:acyl carrier protein